MAKSLKNLFFLSKGCIFIIILKHILGILKSEHLTVAQFLPPKMMKEDSPFFMYFAVCLFFV